MLKALYVSCALFVSAAVAGPIGDVIYEKADRLVVPGAIEPTVVRNIVKASRELEVICLWLLPIANLKEDDQLTSEALIKAYRQKIDYIRLSDGFRQIYHDQGIDGGVYALALDILTWLEKDTNAVVWAHGLKWDRTLQIAKIWKIALKHYLKVSNDTDGKSAVNSILSNLNQYLASKKTPLASKSINK